MVKIKKLIKFIGNRNYRTYILGFMGFYHTMNDQLYITRIYSSIFEKKINLKNPKTFSEKIQWLKLYDRSDRYTKMVDKYEVKEYVKNLISEEYLIPTIGIYDSWNQINFKKLPNQFVIKCTHDSGGVVICKDKKSFNMISAKKKIMKSMNKNYYYSGREWPYKNVKPRIIIEPFMKNGDDGDLNDYKFYCFNGIPKYCQVITDRSTNECIDFFDMKWNHQEFVGLTPGCINSNKKIEQPINFEKMKEIATKLAKDIRFVRIDFYEANGKLFFGEITFYPASGFGKFTPDIWNEKLGDMIKL